MLIRRKEQVGSEVEGIIQASSPILVNYLNLCYQTLQESVFEYSK